MNLTIIGLTITSSWGNGHATTYRALVREFERRGHRVTFLEHDKPWYANNRDMPEPPFGTTVLYASLDELQQRHEALVRDADAVIVGSYVPQGVEVGTWAQRVARGPVVFYDIDTPVTLAQLRQGTCDYLTPDLIARYAAYLSFSAGPTLDLLEREYQSPMARALHCSVDAELYAPTDTVPSVDLGYLGTYSADRQPTVETLLVEPARRWGDGRFNVAGPQYPTSLDWPANMHRVEHCPPNQHRDFYNACRWTLNVTRQDMIAAGWSPSVRLFEAAACGTPIISDMWPGLGDYFPLGTHLLTAATSDDTLAILRDVTDEQRQTIADNARQVVLQHHTAAKRAEELENLLKEAAH